jgi:hypothetical protein
MLNISQNSVCFGRLEPANQRFGHPVFLEEILVHKAGSPENRFNLNDAMGF